VRLLLNSYFGQNMQKNALFLLKNCKNHPVLGANSRGQGRAMPPTPWIFIHGTNIVDRGVKILFSAFFAIFRSFFGCPPLEEAK